MSAEGPKPYNVVYDADLGQIQYSFQSGYVTIPEASVNAITQLTGDVTAAGPGSAAATVVQVGGALAAAVAAATALANAATSANTASTIVKRDGSGNFSAGTISAALTGNVTGVASQATASQTAVDFTVQNGLINLVNTSYRIFGNPGSSAMEFIVNTALPLAIQTGDIQITTSGNLNWLSGAFGTSADTGLDRTGAGVLEVNNGTPGTLRTLNAGTVNVGTTSPEASAVLQASSTTQGFLPPRMTTTQRTAISSPADGLTVFDTTTHSTWNFQNGSWVELAAAIPGKLVASYLQTSATDTTTNSATPVATAFTQTISLGSASNMLTFSLDSTCDLLGGGDLIVYLYVDGVNAPGGTYITRLASADHSLISGVHLGYYYQPGDTSAHTYAIMISSVTASNLQFNFQTGSFFIQEIVYP